MEEEVYTRRRERGQPEGKMDGMGNGISSETEQGQIQGGCVLPYFHEKRQ